MDISRQCIKEDKAFKRWLETRKLKKNERLTCPVCGRRLFGWLVIDEDGEPCGYVVPKHKPKGWWKKPKQKKKERKSIR